MKFKKHGFKVEVSHTGADITDTKTSKSMFIPRDVLRTAALASHTMNFDLEQKMLLAQLLTDKGKNKSANLR